MRHGCPCKDSQKNDTNDNAAIPLWEHFATECLWAKWPNCHNKSLWEFQLSLAKSVHANKRLGSALSVLSGCYDTEGKVLIRFILHCKLCPDKEIHVSYCDKVKHVIEVVLLQHDWGYCKSEFRVGYTWGFGYIWNKCPGASFHSKKPFNVYSKDLQGCNISNYYSDHYTKDALWLCYYCHPSLPTLPANPPTVDALNEATVWHSNSEVSKAMDILLMSPKQWPD